MPLLRKNSKFNIKVVGVGGCGGNIVRKIFDDFSLPCETIIINTDLQALSSQRADYLLPIGERITKGGGAGTNPTIGRRAAQESEEQIIEVIKNADLLILVAGLGNGTGTGASPIIARIAREMGILSVGVFTLPFEAENKKEVAEETLKELQNILNTTVVIDNNKIKELVNSEVTLDKGFELVDRTVKDCVEAILSIVQYPFEINLDFNDLKSVLDQGGIGYFAKGVATRKEEIESAIMSVAENPLLPDVSIENVQGVLLNIKINPSFKMDHFDLITRKIKEFLPQDAKMKIGLNKSGDPNVEYAEIYLVGATGKRRSTLNATRKKGKLDKLSRKVPPGVRAMYLFGRNEEQNQ